MSFVGGLLGTSGGANGTGFASPTGTNPEEVKRAYDQTQAGIGQQQGFVNAMNPGSLQAMQSQQDLLNQLGQGAQGKGPNPAQQQLQNNTGQNVSNQAALMAGQRGASANTGMMARQAAQQGAQTQQQGAGQAATLAAQQQIQQQQALAQQQQAMVGQNQAGLNALNQYSSAQQGNLLGMQGNINNGNAGLAGGMQGGQSNLMGGLMGGIGSAVGGGMFSGGAGALDDFDVASAEAGLMANGGQVKMAEGGDLSTLMPVQQSGVNSMDKISNPDSGGGSSGPQSNIGKMLMNSGPQQSAKSSSSGIGGGIGNLAGLAGKGLMSWGEHEALPAIGDALSGAGDWLAGGVAGAGAGIASVAGPVMAGGAGDAVVSAAPLLLAARGGQVPVMLSPGERKLTPEQAKAAAGGKINPMKAGQKVPGKPKVAGAKNDYANDTVKDKVEAGSIIIPRSITQGKDAHRKSMEFVRACLAKSGKGLK